MRAVLLACFSTLLAASIAAAAPQSHGTDGQIAVATTSGHIVLIDRDGHRLTTLTSRAGASDWAPAWSPDRQSLAFARSTDGRRSFHV